VDYQFASSQKHHQTGFIYRIVHAVPTPVGERAIRVGEDIPLESLQLKGDTWGGRYAN
jgi:hypothetical protein